MWQDEFFSKRDNHYVCWDCCGEFIALCITKEQAREIISNYKDTFKRRQEQKTIQDINSKI